MNTTRSQKPAETAELGGVLTRALPASDVATDTAARTLSFPFSSTRPVERWAWFDDGLPDGSSSIFDEILSHDPEHWNLERVEEGVCPYLKNHRRDQKLGRVMSVSFEGDRGLATVKLRRCADADQELLDLEDGVSGGVSFGYQVFKYRVVTPAEYEGEGWDRRLIKKAVLEGIDIMLLEVSAEEIPADPSVGFGKARGRVDLRTIQLDGDPHWEAERATPAELKKGDWVAWNSSGGTSKGRIETVATSGVITPVPKGPVMEGSAENPAYLVVVWSEADDASWKPSTTKVCKRAANLTEIASLKSLAGGAERQSKPKAKRTKPVGRRTKQQTQTRELTIADFLTVSDPTLDDILQAFKDTTVAIEAAVAEDDTLDMPALCQSAIDDLKERLYVLYDIASSDNATEDEGTDTGAMAMEGERTVSRSPAEQQRDREFKQLQEKLAQMERQQTVTTTLGKLREQAIQLRDGGKMTHAEFNDKFGDFDAAVEKYVRADDSSLKSLTERIDDIEKYAEPLVEFRSKLRNEPLTAPKAANVYDAELEDYKKSKAGG